MGTSSGKWSQIVSSSGSEEELQVLMDQRKRKRMQSNRESARRSRMRKQQHLDELTARAAQLRRDNAQIAASVGVTAQHLAGLQAENSVLRAQMSELSQRLQSLNDIVSYINSCGTTVLECETALENNTSNYIINSNNNNSAGFVMNNAVNLVRLSHPIMANAADMFLY